MTKISGKVPGTPLNLTSSTSWLNHRKARRRHSETHNLAHVLRAHALMLSLSIPSRIHALMTRFPSHFALAFSSSTSASSCASQRSLKTSSENLFALSRERWRMARASAGGSSRALAKPSANCSSVEAWKPVMGTKLVVYGLEATLQF